MRLYAVLLALAVLTLVPAYAVSDGYLYVDPSVAFVYDSDGACSLGLNECWFAFWQGVYTSGIAFYNTTVHGNLWGFVALLNMYEPDLDDFVNLSVKVINAKAVLDFTDPWTMDAILSAPSGTEMTLVLITEGGNLDQMPRYVKIRGSAHTMPVASYSEFAKCTECWFYDPQLNAVFIKAVAHSDVPVEIGWGSPYSNVVRSALRTMIRLGVFAMVLMSVAVLIKFTKEMLTGEWR